ncbi:MAG TPA: alpha/beta hydrolase [Solirubrobacteraceae bacterium]|jgi:pimeloyl-ACP methyl ester carboxylesterase
MNSTTTQTQTLEVARDDGVRLQTYVDGAGPTLVIIPSYGRGSGTDYDDLVERVVGAGWQILRPQPRGVAGSVGPMTGLTLHDLADDVAVSIRAHGEAPAVVLGHAYGNMLGRLLATDHPDLVRALVLAAPTTNDFSDDLAAQPFIAGDTSRPRAERLAALQRVFFAPGHDATPWLDGWYRDTLAMQGAAVATVPIAEYWAGGQVPILELIAAADPFMPEDRRHDLQAEFPDRVTTVVIDGASHALFPEQPDAIAAALLPWLARFTG